MEKFVDHPGQGFGYAFGPGKLGNGGFLYVLYAAEFLQKSVAFGGADAFDLVQDGSGHAAAALFPVVFDGKAMDLLLDGAHE